MCSVVGAGNNTATASSPTAIASLPSAPEAKVNAASRERPHLFEDDCRAWHRGHADQESRRCIPERRKLVGSETSVSELEVVCD